MILHYSRDDLMSGNQIVLADENDKTIIRFTNMQKLGGRKYKVTDTKGNTIYMVEETDVETKNEYTIFDSNMNVVARILRKGTLLSSKIIIKYAPKKYKFDFTLVKLRIILSKDNVPVVTASIASVKTDHGNELMLEAVVTDTEDTELSITIFTTLGILYTDSY